MLKIIFVVIRQPADVQQTRHGVAKEKMAIVFTILIIEHNQNDVAHSAFFGNY